MELWATNRQGLHVVIFRQIKVQYVYNLNVHLYDSIGMCWYDLTEMFIFLK